MDIEWIAFCVECGEIAKTVNGDWAEAIAKKHKRENLHHKVILGTYIISEDTVFSLR